MKRFALLLVPSLALGLAGCTTDSYSPAIQYALRTDPLVLDDKLGDEKTGGEFYDPDPPGVLPILFAKDVLDTRNPMHFKGLALFNENKLRDPTLLSKKDRDVIDDFLGKVFGTPREPWVGQLDSNKSNVLQLGEDALQRGSSLYRVHCIHCHGLTGDGRGPTARWINPHPRDFRRGLFKFASVDQTASPRPPRRDDLVRTLKHGIEGTAMPSFSLLPAAEIEDLVSYVIHLSLRGQVEYETIKGAFSYDPQKKTLTAETDAAVPDYLLTIYGKLSNDWYESQTPDKAIKPVAYPYKDWVTEGGHKKMGQDLVQSIRRGHKLFIGVGADKATGDMPSKEDAKKANCISCHTDFGRQAKFKFDSWGTLTRPRSLIDNQFRGGRRPVDVYYRIHSGITGSGMNAFGASISSPEQIWDLVNFVQTLPFPAMRKELGIDIN